MNPGSNTSGVVGAGTLQYQASLYEVVRHLIYLKISLNMEPLLPK